MDKKTFLDWGLTSDWHVEGPRKRRNPGIAGCTDHPSIFSKEEGKIDCQNACSEGYGEMTEGSIERLFLHLRTLVTNQSVASSSLLSRFRTFSGYPLDHGMNMTTNSTFIDIGSGYGKVVMHAKLSAKVAKAVGVEYVASRAAMAISSKNELVYGEHAFMTDDARCALRVGCDLKHGDATKYGEFKFSHVYMYDKVFSDSTLQLLASQLGKSPFKVLISYQRIETWRRHGLNKIVEVGALRMRTTGGQTFKAYIFVKQAKFMTR